VKEEQIDLIEEQKKVNEARRLKALADKEKKEE